MDIVATNAYILHKELCTEKGETPLSHLRFLEELTAQLCGVSATVPPVKAPAEHLPVPVSQQEDPSRRASYGRKSCVHCRTTKQKIQSTPWKCETCDESLCLVMDRNCFHEWHQA
ncbi:unnamed protein product [Knipowitschia caucasica]